MSHQPITLVNVAAALSHRTLFENLCATITHGQHIVVIGKNGAGKSTLLALLAGAKEVHSGTIVQARDACIRFVPQLMHSNELSGGQQFHRYLNEALVRNPNVLLLDEPTNHLDSKNRSSLMRMLRNFPHTLVVATHDEELIRQGFDTIWHIEHGHISVFPGSYDDYLIYRDKNRSRVDHALELIEKQKRKNHQALMREQTRAKKSRQMGEKSIANRKWPTIVSSAKARRAEETSGKKRAALFEQREDLIKQRLALRQSEIIVPTFHMPASTYLGAVLRIKNGSIGYSSPLITEINFAARSGERIVIAGANGSGKSTLLKALLSDSSVWRDGEWQIQPREHVGYLDQNYKTLSPQKTVFTTIASLRPDWTVAMVRSHLNDFLFRKNEEVNCFTDVLSGGERARLSLCLIAAQAPKLLLLDEVTNNVDSETRDHLIQILSAYVGCLIVISHDETFVQKLSPTAIFAVHNGSLVAK